MSDVRNPYEALPGTAASIALPEPADLLADPMIRERFEQTSAALEAAELVRAMRRQALSVTGMRGISQDDLAQRTGLSQPRISQIENGKGRDGITYAVLRRIAHACGLDWRRMLFDAVEREWAAPYSIEAANNAMSITQSPVAASYAVVSGPVIAAESCSFNEPARVFGSDPG